MYALVLLAPKLKNLPVPEEEPGISLWVILVIVAGVILALGAVILLLALKKQKPAEEICSNCGKVIMADWPRCMFCKTARGGGGKASLAFLSGPMQGRTLDLDGPVTTIGSAPGSTVTLNDAGVSRKHAGIRKTAEGFELADLGSTNGVYVNGEKVAKRKLQLGDVIRVGTTEMVFKN
jgi:Inner membrane component of T3SS, cytoplasmic domain